jgi:hypothetical protein
MAPVGESALADTSSSGSGRSTGLGDFPQGAPLIVRVLWAARWKIGALLGWDRPNASLGCRVTSLRNRPPRGIRDAPSGSDLENLPFLSLHLL